MSKLTDEVQRIKEGIAEKEKAKQEAVELELFKGREQLLKEFEIGFAEVIPLLKEEGIEYSAHYNTQWTYQGAYILFKKGDRELKMDFLNRDRYRYEYNSYKEQVCGQSTYGAWGLESFLLFIDAGLYQPLPAQPVEREPDIDGRNQDGI